MLNLIIYVLLGVVFAVIALRFSSKIKDLASNEQYGDVFLGMFVALWPVVLAVGVAAWSMTYLRQFIVTLANVDLNEVQAKLKEAAEEAEQKTKAKK